MRLLVDLEDAGAEDALTLLVLTVQPLDQLGARPPALIVGVMPVAQHELAARGGMVPDAPAPRLVTVELLHQLIYPCADRPEDTDLRPGPSRSRTRTRSRGRLHRRCRDEPGANSPGE